jgi:BTB/POZ domain-containing protein 10
LFSRGEYEIADGTNPAIFSSILEYYQTGVIHCPPHISICELREACDYFLLPFNASTIKCQNLVSFPLLICKSCQFNFEV